MELKWQKYRTVQWSPQDHYGSCNNDIYYNGWTRRLCDEQNDVLLKGESLHAKILFVSFGIMHNVKNEGEFTLLINSPVSLLNFTKTDNSYHSIHSSIQECKDYCKYMLLNFATIVSENFNID